MAKVDDLLHIHTGHKWDCSMQGFNGASVVMTCPEYPNVKVVWNSWAKLVVDGKQVFKSRNFRTLLSVFNKYVEKAGKNE